MRRKREINKRKLCRKQIVRIIPCKKVCSDIDIGPQINKPIKIRCMINTQSRSIICVYNNSLIRTSNYPLVACIDKKALISCPLIVSLSFILFPRSFVYSLVLFLLIHYWFIHPLHPYPFFHLSVCSSILLLVSYPSFVCFLIHSLVK